MIRCFTRGPARDLQRAKRRPATASTTIRFDDDGKPFIRIEAYERCGSGTDNKTTLIEFSPDDALTFALALATEAHRHLRKKVNP